MHEFLVANRAELIRRRAKVARRPAPEARGKELEFGIAFFLDQLIETLQAEKAVDPARVCVVSGSSGGVASSLSEMGDAATKHGRELASHGFTIDQVVHDYGDLCQAITELAFENDAPIATKEFHTLNRCLDNAIADAVTEFHVSTGFCHCR